jgi:hypothetical protein
LAKLLRTGFTGESVENRGVAFETEAGGLEVCEGGFAGEEREDLVRGAGDAGVGIAGDAGLGLDGAVADGGEGEEFLAAVESDADGGSLGVEVADIKTDGEDDPMVAGRIVGIPIEEGGTPSAEGGDDGFDGLAAGGETVEDGGDGGRGEVVGDDALLFEFMEAVGEEVGGDAGQSLVEVGVPAGFPD